MHCPAPATCTDAPAAGRELVGLLVHDLPEQLGLEELRGVVLLLQRQQAAKLWVFGPHGALWVREGAVKVLRMEGGSSCKFKSRQGERTMNLAGGPVVHAHTDSSAVPVCSVPFPSGGDRCTCGWQDARAAAVAQIAEALAGSIHCSAHPLGPLSNLPLLPLPCSPRPQTHLQSVSSSIRSSTNW
jgi:hypothetical protein